jgi:hypothetical protein
MEEKGNEKNIKFILGHYEIMVGIRVLFSCILFALSSLPFISDCGHLVVIL